MTNGKTAEQVRHAAHLGWAKKFETMNQGTFLHVAKNGWYVWDGKRYRPDDRNQVRRAVHSMFALERARIAKIEDPEAREKAEKYVARHETASAISGILTEAAVLEAFSVTADDLDSDPYLLNVANGTMELDTGKMREHRQSDRITKICRAAYDPAAASTRWTEFLEKVLPDNLVCAYLQRVIGLSLFGRVTGDKQILLIMTGVGANGKTTCIEAVTFALGDYAMPAEPTLLMATGHGDKHPTGVADLMGARFVSVSETEENRRFNIALLKMLTGGDRIKARLMRQDFFYFDPSHLLVLATNHLPRIDDVTESVWRRIRVIPFGVTIPKEERNSKLKQELECDADAILTWTLDGWTDYQQLGKLDEPAGVLAATDEYRGDSDSVGRFIADECDTGTALGGTQTKVLHARWEKWAAREGCEPIGSVTFGKHLDNKGFPAEKSGDRIRRGIVLKPGPGNWESDWNHQ